MSCNGCRVLRKGCSDNCMLRQCLQSIDSPQAQAHATVFVAKFFGRAGLMSFISSVPEDQRPALFQSLLYEAVGRTVNPVNGAVGLLWTGSWHVCQSAVETVLRGGALGPRAESRVSPDNASEYCNARPAVPERRFTGRPHPKRRATGDVDAAAAWGDDDLGLCLAAKRRAETPSDENCSETTTLGSSSLADNLESSALGGLGTIRALRLFI